MGGWSESKNWQRMRRRDAAGVPGTSGRWTVPDVATMLVAFAVRWELGVAFIGLKVWHQASGYPGSIFSFVHEKWEQLVGVARSLMSGASMPSLHIGPKSSGNVAFDTWRRNELSRIEAEREKLRTAERDFTTYRDELLHVKDREDFQRFMQARDDA